MGVLVCLGVWCIWGPGVFGGSGVFGVWCIWGLVYLGSGVFGGLVLGLSGEQLEERDKSSLVLVAAGACNLWLSLVCNGSNVERSGMCCGDAG